LKKDLFDGTQLILPILLILSAIFLSQINSVLSDGGSNIFKESLISLDKDQGSNNDQIVSIPSIPSFDQRLAGIDNNTVAGTSDNKIQPDLLKGIGSNKIPNQYIVVLKQNVHDSPEAAALHAKNQGAQILHIYEHAIRGFAIKISNEKVLEAIKRNPNVDFVEQDMTVQAFSQNLPKGVNRIDADHSPTISGDGSGSVNTDIAILDTGIDLAHPDLSIYRKKTFVAGTTSANDDNGHGTHVAGIAAAKDNTIRVVGVAPGARLWALKVLDATGSGSISTIIAGIDYITQHAGEIDIVNMSFGCECSSSSLDTAINNSVAKGVTFVAAAGNNHKDASTFSPAKNPNVISVSAVADSDGKCGGLGSQTSYGNDDSFATFSNYGSTVDISAPGVDILSTYKGSSYTKLSGTSMAAPHVAGAAALYKAFHNSASPLDIRNQLRSLGSKSSTICDGKGHGYFTNDPDSIHEPLLYARKIQ
jgi:subtilisin